MVNSTRVGVVAIGRNEGDRLRACLASIIRFTNQVVYVDSGSEDSSVALAGQMLIPVVMLDMKVPFTAARARNAGFSKLRDLWPNVELVFFVDGDCEVAEGFMNLASNFLFCNPSVAIVCGLRREKFPNGSVYNMLCDFEWGDCAVGETQSCGGDALIRTDAFIQVHGYSAGLICGEEPEMCIRIRKLGWKIWRLDCDMTFHDAAMYRFDQWFKRMVRGGYSFAQGVALHGGPPERHGVKESIRIWVWSTVIPLTSMGLMPALGLRALWVFAIYPIQVVRLAIVGKRSIGENWIRAGALILSKFPEVVGQWKFIKDRVWRVQAQLIEYK